MTLEEAPENVYIFKESEKFSSDLPWNYMKIYLCMLQNAFFFWKDMDVSSGLKEQLQTESELEGHANPTPSTCSLFQNYLHLWQGSEIGVTHMGPVPVLMKSTRAFHWLL